MRTIKTYRKVGAFYIAWEADFSTVTQLGEGFGAIQLPRGSFLSVTSTKIERVFLLKHPRQGIRITEINEIPTIASRHFILTHCNTRSHSTEI
jgi:hypothetical protein